MKPRQRFFIAVFFAVYFLFPLIFPHLVHGEESSRQNAIELCNKSVVKVEHAEIGGGTDWLGSGVFFSNTRLITNAHVVGELPESPAKFRRVYSDEDLNKVIFWVVYGGKKYRAKFIGRDPEVDLAILETDHEIPGVVPAPLGDSSKVKKGDRVIACGNPYGMENTITEGIVSGKEKKIGLLSYEDYIQTDAAINPGNSGGPLVSLETASVAAIINSGIPMAQNMSYAIPINLFKSIRDSLVGTVKHAWLGLEFPLEKLNDTEGFSGLLTIYNYTGIEEIDVLKQIQQEVFNNGGVLITDIMRTLERRDSSFAFSSSKDAALLPDDRTPASRVDIRIADILNKFGEYPVKTSKDLIYAIFRSTPGEETIMHIIRFGKNGEREEKDISTTPIIRIPESARGKFY